MMLRFKKKNLNMLKKLPENKKLLERVKKQMFYKIKHNFMNKPLMQLIMNNKEILCLNDKRKMSIGRTSPLVGFRV